nr:MAG TPA: hypothetical protein [Caudoviricetes sp.]
MSAFALHSSAVSYLLPLFKLITNINIIIKKTKFLWQIQN